jgi:hypothetical protein
MNSGLCSIPIFIISFNRLTVLKVAIESYRQLPGHSIIVHDTGSTYLPLLDYLSELERQGAVIYRNRASISRWDDLNSVNDTVRDWLGKHPTSRYYCVTDPDIMLESACSDLFEFYEFMLKTRGPQVIGPMLRIDDIPHHYPLRERVISGHAAQYWDKEPCRIDWKGRSVGYQFTRIDTTFGMYSRDVPFQRYRAGIRTYEPYWARHLDWYIDPTNMQEDQRLYLSSASQVSHWGGHWLRDKLHFGVDPPLTHLERNTPVLDEELLRRPIHLAQESSK